MTEANLCLGIALSGVPLVVAWLLDKCFASRAAVRSLRLRAAVLASVAIASVPIAPLRVARPAWLPAPITARTSEPSVPETAAVDSPAFDLNRAPVLDSPPEPGSLSALDAAPEAAVANVANDAELRASGANWSLQWPRLALEIWLGGAIALLMWSAWCHAHIARVRRGAQVLASGQAFEEAARIAGEWKIKPPRLLRTRGIASPFASGVWRASICWPEGIESESSPAPWRAILRHEMAHARRNDCAWNALAQMARAILWPQPMLWWACRALHKNAEDVCDEAALEGCAPTAYARGLLDLSQRLGASASTCGAASRTAGAGALPSQPELSRRVARILKLRGSDAWRIGWRTRAATLTGLCGVIGASVLATSTEAPRAQEAAASTSNSAAVAVDLSSPQKTLDTFLVAARAGDARALVACVQTENSAEDIREYAKSLIYFAPVGGSHIISPWRIKVASDGASALAQANVQTQNGQNAPLPPAKALLRLVKTASGWKVSADTALASRDIAFNSIAVRLADPSFKRMREWARSHGRAVIEGQVLLADGSPASGATVRLQLGFAFQHKIEGSQSGFDTWAKPREVALAFNQSTKTDSNGRYRVEGLTDGTYSVRAFWPETEANRPRRSFDNDFDAQQIALRQGVKARENETVQAPTLKTLVTARLDVLTVDARDGKPLADAVWFAHPSSSRSSSSIARTSGEDGHAIMNVPPGKVWIAIASNFSEKGASAMTTPRGKYLTNSQGKVQFDDKPAISFSGGTTITMASGETRRVTVRLMPLSALPKPKPLPAPRLPIPANGRGSGILIGRVQFEDGRPAPGVAVVATMQQAARWDVMRRLGLAMTSDGVGWDRLNRLAYFKAITDARGEFRLSGLISAPYDILTAKPGEEIGLGGSGDVGGTVSGAIQGVWGRDGATIRRAQPIVLVAGAVIRGRITDKRTGVGVAGVTVGCYGPHRPRSSDSVAGTNSRSDGTFELRVAPGKSEIYLSGPSSRDASENFRFSDNGQRANAYVLTLPRGLFYAGGGDSQLDGGATGTDTRGATMFAINAKSGESHTLNFQLRRLRRATAAEDSEA